MKPVLPTLNFAKVGGSCSGVTEFIDVYNLSALQVKQIQAEDNGEAVPSPSSTSTRPRLQQQRSSVRASNHQLGSNFSSGNSNLHTVGNSSSGSQEASRRAAHATAGTSKPSVPMLNLAKHTHDSGLQVGFGSSGQSYMESDWWRNGLPVPVWEDDGTPNSRHNEVLNRDRAMQTESPWYCTQYQIVLFIHVAHTKCRCGGLVLHAEGIDGFNASVVHASGVFPITHHARISLIMQGASTPPSAPVGQSLASTRR